MPATLEDFRRYLNDLKKSNDGRLQDTLTVYDSVAGEYFPAEFVEFNGDDILDDGSIFILTKDWNE